MPLFGKANKRFLLLIFLLFFHLMLISIQVPLGSEPSYLARAVFTILAPLERVAASAGRAVGKAWSGYFRLRGVRAENQRIKQEIFFLRQENRFLQEALRFSRGEKEIRDSLAAFGASVRTARVIGVDASDPYKSIVLDLGSRDGVRPDLAVCDRHGRLVGRTIEPVTRNECRVQLLTDDASGVSVISDADRIIGILSGDGLGGCLLKYVLSTALGGKDGEELLTTGFDGIYPPGIKTGRIVSIEPTASLFKKILVEPHFSFRDLDLVAVLLIGPGEGKTSP